MSATGTVKRGDTHDITLTVLDGTGAPVNLTGATVRLLVRSAFTPGAAATVLTATATNPAAGVVTHTLTGTLAAGDYDLEVEVTIGGKVSTSPSSGFARLCVAPDIG